MSNLSSSNLFSNLLGPVVQNFVSLTLLLSPQFVNYMYISTHCYFLLCLHSKVGWLGEGGGGWRAWMYCDA